jgi:phage tail-like protein
MPMKEPRPASYWKVVLNGSENAGLFREVSIGKNESEIIDFKSSDMKGNPTIRRVPGINKAGNITLVRGIDENKILWDWRQKVIDKGVEDPSTRCDGTITLHDHGGGTIAAFSFLQGWPASIDYGNVNSAGTDIAVEKIEIAHEGVKRLQ